MKIQIKTSFWQRPLEQQRDKLVTMLFWMMVVAIINVAYYLFTNSDFMFGFNLFVLIVLGLIQTSYNKRNKEKINEN